MRPALTLRRAVRAATPGLALAMAGLAAACADGPTTPVAPAPAPAPAAAPAASAAAARSGASAGTAATDDTLRTAFTIVPGKPTRFAIAGAFAVDLAANATCDPARSTYGPDQWDAPCPALAAPLAVRVEAWRAADGTPRIRFTPDLRFAPHTQNTVTLATRALDIKRSYRMDWCPSGGGACVDERLFDRNMITRFEPATGVLVRRIKHFSGYVVVANRRGTDGEY